MTNVNQILIKCENTGREAILDKNQIASCGRPIFTGSEIVVGNGNVVGKYVWEPLGIDFDYGDEGTDTTPIHDFVSIAASRTWSKDQRGINVSIFTDEGCWELRDAVLTIMKYKNHAILVRITLKYDTCTFINGASPDVAEVKL